MTVEAGSVRRPLPQTVPAGDGYWWVQPAAVFVGFTAFVIYGAWSVINAGGHHWLAGPYLSPFYSPLLKVPGFPFSSAFLVAWAPLGFRATCYYYRKAYYRSYFLHPPACARAEVIHRGGENRYRGERAFPLILNNFHRYFLYLAVFVLAVLWFDTINAFHYKNGLYVGVGSLLMLLNVSLLTLYTFSCHALRHLVGGSVNCFTCSRAGKVRHGLWRWASAINPFHGTFAWFSLVSVVVVDIYIRYVSTLSGCFGPHTGC